MRAVRWSASTEKERLSERTRDLTREGSFPDRSPGGDMKTEHTSGRMLRAELSLNSCTGEDWEMTARGGRAVGGEMINS